MRVGCRSVALATALAAVVAFGATAHAATANKCASGKVKLAGKTAAGILGCYGKGAGKTDSAGNPLTVAACVSKVRGKFIVGSQKIDSKQKVTPPTDPSNCPHATGLTPGTGDEGTVIHDLNGALKDLADDLDPNFPHWTIPSGSIATKGSKCTAGKYKCVAKLMGGVAKCYGKALGAGSQVNTAAPGCIAGVEAKFSGGGVGCMDKLEAKEVPPKSDNTNVCTAGNGDATSLKKKAEHWVFHNQAFYGQTASAEPAACASQIDFQGTSTDGILDTGWTGNGHDSTVISDGHVSVTVNGCTGDATAPACGVCTYEGAYENVAGEFQANRCVGDTRKTCEWDEDCPGVGPCRYHFGTYLPLAAGGVTTCVQNTFVSALTGTADYGTGASTGIAQNQSIVYTGLTQSNPCARCVGDATPNDGVKGGTCSGGLDNGQPCDANGSSPNASFGTTSLDCRITAGAIIATLPINLNNTMGTKHATLTASNPNCRAATFTTNKCQCDTCSGGVPGQIIVCSSNADCPAGGTCGGKRCIGTSPNIDGTVCTLNSDCPGGACNVPGAATAPNQCDGGSGDCFADAGTPSPNDRICGSGPFQQFCGPVETFRGCTSNAQCNVECGTGGACSDTCSVGRFRDCFDNGVLGEDDAATGAADPPVAHQSDPRLAALFCVAGTNSGAVNAAAGLPGLGRLELQGHTIDNGTM